MTKEPHTVDRYVGQRIRARRMALGMGQETLARHCGITFQQIQKYEKGANRVSASRLHDLARALACRATFFLEGLPAQDAGPSEEQLLEGAFLASPQGVEIARAWPQLGDQARQSVVAIVQSIAAGSSARAA